MGSSFSSSLADAASFCLVKRRYQIRVAGPAQAGKTSIIKWLKYKDFFKIPPTEELEIDSVDFKDSTLVMWDSRQHFDDTVPPNYINIRGIIYVVDSSDPGRLRIANRTLERLLSDLPDASVLLVLATKQDRAGALSLTDIQAHLMLEDVRDKECGVFACSSKTGEGIEEGISWMCRQLAIQEGHVCGCSNQLVSCRPPSYNISRS